MLRPVIYSHLRLQCKARVVGIGSLATPKMFYIHRKVSCHFAFILLLSASGSGHLRLHQAQGTAEPGMLLMKRTASFTLMLLRALYKSLVLFHKRIVWVNRGRKAGIPQCFYITCNAVRRLNIFVEENYIRLNLSYHLERTTKPRSQLSGSHKHFLPATSRQTWGFSQTPAQPRPCHPSAFNLHSQGDAASLPLFTALLPHQP